MIFILQVNLDNSWSFNFGKENPGDFFADGSHLPA